MAHPNQSKVFDGTIVPFQKTWQIEVPTPSGPTTFPHFYELPQDLKESHLDAPLWPIVERINRSGWVWTAESCAGHPDAPAGKWASNDGPYLRLVLKADNESIALYWLERSLRAHGLFGDHSHPISARNVPNHGLAHCTWKNTREGSPWIELLVYVLNPYKTLEARDAGLTAWHDFGYAILLPAVLSHVV